jgi:hypothetical protein
VGESLRGHDDGVPADAPGGGLSEGRVRSGRGDVPASRRLSKLGQIPPFRGTRHPSEPVGSNVIRGESGERLEQRVDPELTRERAATQGVHLPTVLNMRKFVLNICNSPSVTRCRTTNARCPTRQSPSPR